MSWIKDRRSSRQSLQSLRNGDQCWEDQADDKRYQLHQHRDQSERNEAWDSHKHQAPGLSCIWRGSKPEILSRKAQTTAAFTRMIPVWTDRLSVPRLMRSLVTFIFLYACESWTLTAELQRRIQVMEMRCIRKILRILFKDHVTNEEVRAKIQEAIGPHEDLLIIE